MKRLTEQEVKQIIEDTFNQLDKKNKISLANRQKQYGDYLKLKGFDSKIIEILLFGVNEFTSLWINDNGEMGTAYFKDNRILININKVIKMLDDPFDYESIYKKETVFIRRNTKTKQDWVKWVICHEYAHIMRLDKVHHTNDFFQTVENLYQTL